MRIKCTGRKEIGDHPSLNLTTRTKRVQACKTKQMHRIPTQDCKAQGARNMCAPTPTQHQVFIKTVNGLTPLLLCITGAAVTCHPWRACNRTRRRRHEQRCSKWWFNVLHCGVECKQSQRVAQRSSVSRGNAWHGGVEREQRQHVARRCRMRLETVTENQCETAPALSKNGTKQFCSQQL